MSRVYNDVCHMGTVCEMRGKCLRGELSEGGGGLSGN